MIRIAALSLCLAAAASFGPAAARAAPPPSAQEEEVHLDFSHVTTVRRAKTLVRKGELIEILLFPGELGGPDIPENRIYVPVGALDALGMALHTLLRFTKEGLIDKMDVHAEYRGDSLVPVLIVMDATHSKKDGGFHPSIKIW